MLTNYNLLIKFFITILTICFSAYCFYLGYVSLNLYKSNSAIPLNIKTLSCYLVVSQFASRHSFSWFLARCKMTHKLVGFILNSLQISSELIPSISFRTNIR